nr:MAG TPA: hypothetical protein [Caudoviricetes sp.]
MNKHSFNYLFVQLFNYLIVSTNKQLNKQTNIHEFICSNEL